MTDGVEVARTAAALVLAVGRGDDVGVRVLLDEDPVGVAVFLAATVAHLLVCLAEVDGGDGETGERLALAWQRRLVKGA